MKTPTHCCSNALKYTNSFTLFLHLVIDPQKRKIVRGKAETFHYDLIQSYKLSSYLFFYYREDHKPDKSYLFHPPVAKKSGSEEVRPLKSFVSLLDKLQDPTQWVVG